MSETNLQGQVAFITGGSSGIGKSCAKRLAELGMKVAICARREEKLNRALDELKSISPDVLAIPMDVSQSGQVKEGVRQIERSLGPIDVLFSNAGIYRWGAIAETTVEEWDQQFEINLKSMFLVTQAVLPSMIKRQSGRIIYVSSTITLEDPPYNTTYDACKWGLEGFAGCLANELCDHNINVHVLRPGFSDTGVFDEIGKPPIDPDWIDPDEYMHVVEFLCKLPKHAQVPELTYMTTFQRREY